MEKFAPIECAESWDNCGVLLEGKENVHTISIILDPTIEALNSSHGEFILSHHPFIFDPLKRVELEIKEKISMLLQRGQTFYAAHTNLDLAPNGISWALSKRICLQEDELSTPLIRTGTVPHTTVKGFIDTLCASLGNDTIKIVGENTKIGRVAAIPGSGFSEDIITKCHRRGITTIVSGDLKHHAALKGLDLGLTLIDAGHRETELPGLQYLAKYLKERMPQVEVELIVPQKPWQYVLNHEKYITK